MKTITINVSEPVYRSFREYAKAHDRTASELIREAMELYQSVKLKNKTSLQRRSPVSVGKVIHPFTGEEDLLQEMIDEHWD